jgi:hypothetical protein
MNPLPLIAAPSEKVSDIKLQTPSLVLHWPVSGLRVYCKKIASGSWWYRSDTWEVATPLWVCHGDYGISTVRSIRMSGMGRVACEVVMWRAIF